jgi:ATP-dependent DNA helicase RecG
MPNRVAREIPEWLSDLLERSDQHEDVEIECKRAEGGLPRDLWETVSAFANTRGGRIVLGVNEKRGFTPEGVANVDARRTELWNALRNPQKVSRTIWSEDDITVERIGDADLLVMRVPAAPRRDRPVYINGNPYNGTYVRRHSADYRCSKAEVDRMIREASGEAVDSTILTGFNLDDLDLAAVTGYRRRFQTRDPTNPWNEYDDWRFLRALGGVTRDRSTGREGLTVAGLLMFGTSESIREWRARHLIDYRVLPGSFEAYDRWTDRISWEGHLYGAFAAILTPLTRDLPTPFELQDGIRSGEGPVQIALREALVNLLVHADYTESDASLILRSPEGFLFRNPGTSRVPEEDMLIGNRSDPRNPTLARMFRQIGFAEEAGTGIPKIVQLWRKLGFQLPEIRQGTDRYEFTIELRYAHLLSDDVLAAGENYPLMADENVPLGSLIRAGRCRRRL